jgi:hypothetical protein
VAAVSGAALLFLTAAVMAQSQAPARLAQAPTAAIQQQTSEAPSELTAASDWPRIYIKDVYVRDAVRGALQGASEWLGAPRCQALLSEFSDKQGRVLGDRLLELKMSLAKYLRVVIIENGETHARCGDEGVLAFTVAGSRMIHVCGRAFARAAQRDAQEVRQQWFMSCFTRSVSARIRHPPATLLIGSGNCAGRGAPLMILWRPTPNGMCGYSSRVIVSEFSGQKSL